MKHAMISIIVATATMTMATPPQARSFRHPPPRAEDRAPGWEIRALTLKAQDEPGVTAELAPDAKQTATGGPSGGVPGFSAH